MFGNNISRHSPCAVRRPPVTSKITAVLVGLLLVATPSTGHAQPANAAARYDLVVVGGTPGGVACAVRAARS